MAIFFQQTTQPQCDKQLYIMLEIKRNERDWAGQLISWIKEAIAKGLTSFEDATNDTSVKLSSGKTKFPDILIFSNKISGIVFNGWELKFPDTPVDDMCMLENALEKARRLKSESFVTWNGTESVIWKIDTVSYSIETLRELKRYPKILTINSRDDLSDPIKYARNEVYLKERAFEILHDLDSLRKNGELKEAIDISDNFISAIKDAQRIIVPQFRETIFQTLGSDKNFRAKFNQWKIYENATLNILATSSRRVESIDELYVLATFTFYNLVGKILFYLTLSENLPKELSNLSITHEDNIKEQLYSYFDKAKAIDYQAVFMPYFTDVLPYTKGVCSALFNLIGKLTAFDFKILPSEVISTVLGNLVPNEEKQKFGQYFTPEILSYLVAFPVVSTKSSMLFDPTAGTGTFLNTFYKLLNHLGNNEHSKLLNQIWGNDISHFPAILSVINLYKENVTQTDNFPRVMRDDFFNLSVGKNVLFPDSKDHTSHQAVPIPKFDGIASNFPFIQQEDIPSAKLSAHFKELFGNTQKAFVKGSDFYINERSDYFAYCIYKSLCFLKEEGTISVITSNAWLGKDYGSQFKKFLLNNFHIRYVVRSVAEHWFSDSKVSTIYFVAEKCNYEKPTKFVTLNFKLSDQYDKSDLSKIFSQIEQLYSNIDNCNPPQNAYWKNDCVSPEAVHSIDGLIDIVIVPNDVLLESIDAETNWDQFFTSINPLEIFDKYLVPYCPTVFHVIRGERTGWNPMFVIPAKNVEKTHINPRFLVPYVKSPTELATLEFPGKYKNYLFVCDQNTELLDKGTMSWIDRFRNTKNKNGSKTIQEACSGHKPYWYTLSPKSANIVTAINPFERIFFAYSKEPFVIDQRLVALQIQDGYDVELIAALLNSICTLLTVEFKGISRNLGALDLNANFLKQMRLLNPNAISSSDKAIILDRFKVIKNRPVGTIFEELKRSDRIEFDKAILSAFNIPQNVLKPLYRILLSAVQERTTLKNK